MDVDRIRTGAPLLGEPLAVELMNTIWADRDGIHDALSGPGGAAAWLAAIGDRLSPRPAGGPGSPPPARRPATPGPGTPPAAVPAAGSAPSAGPGPGADPGPGAVTPRLARELRQLRDALRRLAAVSTGDRRPAAASAVAELEAAVAVVNRACAHAPTWSLLTWSPGGEPRRDPRSAHGPAEAALSQLAEQGVALFTGADRPALRACRAPGCVLYFVRRHPRREWCTDACGNRARVARHYQRHRSGGGRPG